MKKRKIKTSNVVLAILFVVLTIFTISMVITFNRIGSCPDVLIGAVFAGCLGECSILGVIRTTKTKYGETDQPQYDNNGNIIG